MPDNQQNRRRKSGAGWKVIVVVLFMVPGLILAGSGVRIVFSWKAIASWPRVRGVILSSTIKQANGENYCVTHRYEFTVDGRKIVSSSFSPSGDYCYGNRADASEYLYREGAAVTVYYNPHELSQSYLVNWDTPAPWIIIPMGSILLFLGILTLIRLRQVS